MTINTDGLHVVLSVRAASFEVEDVVPYGREGRASLRQAQHAQGVLGEESGPALLELPATDTGGRGTTGPRLADVLGTAKLATCRAGS